MTHLVSWITQIYQETVVQTGSVAELVIGNKYMTGLINSQ